MEQNLLFPGRAKYEGPNVGWFGLLHHSSLFEYSTNVSQRVHYVGNFKAPHEHAVRLHCMIYLDTEKILGMKEFTETKKKYNEEITELSKGYVSNRELLANAFQDKLKKIIPSDPNRHQLRDALIKEETTADAKAYAVYYDKTTIVHQNYFDTYNKVGNDIVLPYIKEHIPNCPWNGRELEFFTTNGEGKRVYVGSL